MTKFIQWLKVSSFNPENTALTVKGALIGIIPLLIGFAQMFHWGWTTDTLTIKIQLISTMIAGVLTLFGLVRKVLLTILN